MKILIADDDRISRRKLAGMLKKWGYEVSSSADGNEAWLAMQESDAPQVLILDWMMPGMDGLEVCRKVRSLNREPYVYILLLTSRNEKEDIVRGMEAGADDYITKPYYPHELEVRLRAGRRIVELNIALLEARNALHLQATHDSLTGLLNRAAALEKLDGEVHRCKRKHENFCAAIMDIDHFKEVNDTYGHIIGDEVLRGTATRLLGTLRPYDILGRYGGEEFLIIMSGCEGGNVLQRYERLRAALAEKPFATSKGNISITASFGIGIVMSGTKTETDTLIAAADQALYAAKKKGRNRVEIQIIE
jgi:diguanylate cyclase (GGDEF)-like protein